VPKASASASATKAEAKAKPEETPKASKAQKESKKPAGGDSSAGEAHIGRLDLRVGRIVSAEKHPDADALYVEKVASHAKANYLQNFKMEKVDVGEGQHRTVISGLVKFVPLEAMQNRPAVLLCNLKPVKMRGILSEAMVMCASTPDKVRRKRKCHLALNTLECVLLRWRFWPLPVEPSQEISSTSTDSNASQILNLIPRRR